MVRPTSHDKFAIHNLLPKLTTTYST